MLVEPCDEVFFVVAVKSKRSRFDSLQDHTVMIMSLTLDCDPLCLGAAFFFRCSVSVD